MLSVMGLGCELVEALDGGEKVFAKVGADRLPLLCWN